MGIQGLLPLLKSIQVNTHISKFSGQTLAVDAYVWLHRGVYTCSVQLVNGQPTTKYVEYVMHRVRMLRHYGIEPYLVFDGGPLPAKRGTEKERAKRREENLEKAKTLMAQGQQTQARDLMSRCVEVSPEMAYQVIKALKAESVAYVVAPYEADSQMAFLERNGLVDGIITEDSDLLVFGCKHVIFKLDHDGNCVDIKRERFGSVTDASMVGWTDKEFRHMAILSGCDYLPSINGIGIKTSHKLLRKYKTVEKVLQYLRLESSMSIPPGYLAAFRQAELPFLYQRVFDPVSKTIVHLNPFDEGIVWDDQKDAYVGCFIEDELAIQLAEGLLDPVELTPIRDINPQYDPVKKQLQGPKPKKGRASLPTAALGSRSIKDFFGAAPKPPTSAPSSVQRIVPRVIGAASGRKTLSEQMNTDRDRKEERAVIVEKPDPPLATSRFFAAAQQKRKRDNTENEAPTFTPRNARRLRPTPPLDDPEDEVKADPVTQEDGYHSPGGSSIVEVSSPIERLSIADDLSPLMARKALLEEPSAVLSPTQGGLGLSARQPTPGPSRPQPTSILVYSTPSPGHPQAGVLFGPDLADTFQDGSSEVEDSDSGGDSSRDELRLETPRGEGALGMELEHTWDEKVDFHADVGLEPDDVDVESDAYEEQARKVMLGWRNQWSHVSTKVASKTAFAEDDPFEVPAPPSVPHAVADSLRFTTISQGSPMTQPKFKRRVPVVGRVSLPSTTTTKKVGKTNSLNKTSRSSLSGADSAPSVMSQKLEAFRYIPY